jgi:hypothetical protein
MKIERKKWRKVFNVLIQLQVSLFLDHRKREKGEKGDGGIIF